MAFDLPAYLARVGLDAAAVAEGPTLATLAAVMAAQSKAIAFENLDVVLGREISIAPADIEQKLVAGGRGGYCFEHNGLLKLALTALGFEDVVPLLCKVRWNKADDEETTFTHVALRATVAGAFYLADVGFAGTNSIEPILIGSAEPQTLADGRPTQSPPPSPLSLSLSLAVGVSVRPTSRFKTQARSFKHQISSVCFQGCIVPESFLAASPSHRRKFTA